jgi:hypothetical protein
MCLNADVVGAALGVALASSGQFQRCFEASCDFLRGCIRHKANGLVDTYLIDRQEIGAKHIGDPFQPGGRLVRGVDGNLRAGNAVRFGSFLDEDGFVDQPIQEIRLNDDGRTKLASAAIAERPIDKDDLTAVHWAFR